MFGPKFGEVKTYHKDQNIFMEGQLGNIGYLIRIGEVTIYKIIDDKKKVLSRLGPGEIFGEMGIVTESPRTACAEASEYCDLVIIDKRTLFKLLKKSPKMVQSITVFLMHRLANTLEMLEHDGSNSLESDKISSICNLLDLMARSDQGINYNSFCERAIVIARVTQKELDVIISRLNKLKLIQIFGEYQKYRSSGCTIRLVDYKQFLKTSKKVK